MGERTSHAAGTFSSVDLATSDADAAKAFYGELFGWEAEDMAGAGGTYTIFRLDGKHVAGCFGTAEGGDAGFPPHWNSYVTVEDADASASRATELGGSELMEAQDVEEIGRMAVIADPSGAAVALWESRGVIGAELVNAPGALCWNDLATTDADGAVTFYGRLFGWTFEQVPAHQIRYRIRNGESENGSLYLQPEEERATPPNWLVYFATADLAASNSRLGQLGGRVVVEPLELPTRGRVSVVTDPQGAAFGLFDGPLDP
jgi:predicted enzyme related to lactoylglutathione lyase